MLQNPYKRTAAAFFCVTHPETLMFHVSVESNKGVSCYRDGYIICYTEKAPPGGLVRLTGGQMLSSSLRP